jgi:hypothetical protein
VNANTPVEEDGNNAACSGTTQQNPAGVLPSKDCTPHC